MLVHQLASFEKLAQEVQFARTWGHVYGYMLVATGRADAMIDPQMNFWDAAAVQPNYIPTFESPDSIGSNGYIHEAVLNDLKT